MAAHPTNGGTGVSTPALVRSIAGDTATLFRKEVELARLEIVEALVARVKAGAAMAAAGVMALLAIGFLGAASAAALDGVMRPWASRLIVAVAFLFIGGIAVALGTMRAKTTPMAPQKTVETVKEDIEWARTQLKR